MFDEKDVRAIAASVRAWSPDAWDDMPDLELYMDQVITYLKREFALFQDETGGSIVTPSIINNYVKAGIVPRPVKKRYARPQLGALKMACLLKRTMPMQSVGRMIAHEGKEPDRQMYDAFCRQLKDVLAQEGDRLEQMAADCGNGPDQARQLALCFAIRSCADRLIADRLLETLNQNESE